MTGASLRRERIRRELTQDEFARQLGFHPTQLSRFERFGRKKIKAHFSTLKRLAAALESLDTIAGTDQ